MAHAHYNIENFPHWVGNHGNWDIYRNDNGNCASIPTDEAAKHGCKASHFGNMDSVRAILGESWLAQQTTGHLTTAPDVRTRVTLKAAPGAVFHVVGWLKPAECSDTTGESLRFCSQDEATHVWCQSLGSCGAEVNEVAARLDDLHIEDVHRVDYWRVREHAIHLAALCMPLSGAKMPRWV